MADKLRKVLHDTVSGLHQAGVFDIKTMREFDALRLPAVKTYTPKQIQTMRLRCRASQAVFAAYLNTNPSTIQKWEHGTKHPNGPSLKLLNIVDRKGLEALV
jgi:putative transcriptional regulator